MSLKIPHLCFLISLAFLQSCSGGKVAEFLDNSFYSDVQNELPDPSSSPKVSTIKKLDTEKSSLKKKNNRATANLKKNKQGKKSDINNIKKLKEYGSKKNDNKNNNLLNDKKVSLKLKRNEKISNPKTYKIIVILKDVDPSSPVEVFTKVLRDANIEFEIERVELYPDQMLRKDTKNKD